MVRRAWLAVFAFSGGAAVCAAIIVAGNRPKPETTAPLIGLGGLPLCKGTDDRLPVPFWTADIDAKGNLSAEPPQKDGQVVYFDFTASNSQAECASASDDKLYSFPKPTNPADNLGGGLAVNLRGNVQFHNGYCTFKGFYMNNDVQGMHQGWVETYFAPLDRYDLIKSNRFCTQNVTG